MLNSCAIARWNYFWSRLAQAFVVLVWSRSENAKTHDCFPKSVSMVAAGTCSIVKSPIWTQWWQHYLWKHDQTQSTMGIRLFSFGFRLVLRTVLSVLSACNRPPKVVFNDNRQVFARLTWVFVAVGQQYCSNAYKRRLTAETKPGHCSVELWSTAKHTGPSLPIQTAYPTTTHRGLRDLQMDTSCYFFHCSPSPLFWPVLQWHISTNNSTVQADSISSSFSLICSCGGCHLCMQTVCFIYTA